RTQAERANALSSVLHRDCAGEGLDGALRRRVGRLPAYGSRRSDGADEENDALLLREHRWKNGARAREGTEDIGEDEVAKRLGVLCHEEPSGVDRGVRDERVD